MASFTTRFIPNIPSGGRNSHLLPEIHTRAKRILQSAQIEQINANSLNIKMCEVWNKKMSGAACSCTNKVEKEVKEKELTVSKVVLDLNEFLNSGNLSIGNATESCPICFGTGYIGGYDWKGTQLLCLESTYPSLVLTNCSLDRKSTWKIVYTGNKSKMEWSVVLPKYFDDAFCSISWYGEVPEDYSLSISSKELSTDILSKESLLLLAGKRVTITLEVNSNFTELEIDDSRKSVKTHKEKVFTNGVYGVFLYLKTKDVIYNVDMPNYTKAFTGALSVQGEIQSNITANFDSKIDRLTPFDVFINSEGKAFRIISVEENTPMGTLISYTCESRLLREHEIYYSLPSRYLQYSSNNKSVSFVF